MRQKKALVWLDYAQPYLLFIFFILFEDFYYFEIFIPPVLTPEKSGADDRIRTGDPLITNEMLYQLSYIGG